MTEDEEVEIDESVLGEEEADEDEDDKEEVDEQSDVSSGNR